VAIGDYLFVHAGIRPGVPIAQQQGADLRWVRRLFLDHEGTHPMMIVHGHSISPEVDDRPNRIGIDTGAYFSGRLTAIGLQGTERWFLQTGT
jgi:serine/threonine protein phosphatase 1